MSRGSSAAASAPKRLAELALVDEPPEELLERAVAVPGARALQPGELVLDECVDALAMDGGDAPRHPVGFEEDVQAGDEVELGLDRVRALVRRAEVARERLSVGRDVGSCGRLALAGRC